jgi:hypothetical protein
MKIKKFRHENVNPDGTVEGGGAVHITTGIQHSSPCECGCSGNKPFVVIGFGRTPDGIVEGLTITFDSTEEYDLFLAGQRVSGVNMQIAQEEKPHYDTISEVDGRYTCSSCGYEFSGTMGDNEIPVVCECQLNIDADILPGDTVYNPISNVVMTIHEDDNLVYANDNYYKIKDDE